MTMTSMKCFTIVMYIITVLLNSFMTTFVLYIYIWELTTEIDHFCVNYFHNNI